MSSRRWRLCHPIRISAQSPTFIVLPLIESMVDDHGAVQARLAEAIEAAPVRHQIINGDDLARIGEDAPAFTHLLTPSCSWCKLSVRRLGQ
jgi:hypothetical protein